MRQKRKRMEISRYKRKETREKTGALEINEKETKGQETKELRQRNEEDD